jgi:hypothetical protein
MAFGRLTPDAEAPLATRIHLINLDLRRCNSVADVVELLAKISDEELIGLQTAFRAAQPGRSSLELARLTVFGWALPLKLVDDSSTIAKRSWTPSLLRRTTSTLSFRIAERIPATTAAGIVTDCCKRIPPNAHNRAPSLTMYRLANSSASLDPGTLWF